MRQLPLDISPHHGPGFDDFVVGPNSQAVQCLRAARLSASPVYLWGPSGSGKTHLLRACAAMQQAHGGQLGWFDATTPTPWQIDPGWVLIVLDDCEALDAGRQQAAFALFVDSTSHGVPWLAAGRLPPVDLPVRDDLRTRLAWGQVFALSALNEAETRAVLRREADRRGIVLSDTVLNYLLTRYQRDLKHLMGLLDRLDEYALGEQRPVTVPLLRRMLAEREVRT